MATARLGRISGNIKPRIGAIIYQVECGTRGETYEITVRPDDVPGVASIELPVMEMEADELETFMEIMKRIRTTHCTPNETTKTTAPDADFIGAGNGGRGS